MQQIVSLNEREIERIVDTYGPMLFRICLVLLCNAHDAEEVVQETFIKYLTKSQPFHDAEHEKAWLITITTNRCKNLRRYNFIRKHMDINVLQLYCKDEENDGLLDDLMKLLTKHKVVLLLYYVEGYKVDEIANILNNKI